MLFQIARSLLFLLPPETAHELTLDSLNAAHRLGLTRWLPAVPEASPRQVMGLTFPNPVGLAAGLDKNGDSIDGLGALGFGFIEVGTVTPRPQPGNSRPRLFRLPRHQALINRMGFNNADLEALEANLRERRWPGILGVNVGKNKDTPADKAVDDYCQGIRQVYPYASYITVNLSSPNTPGLRDLQFGEALQVLLTAVKQTQDHCANQHGYYVPIAVKIAPDMDEGALDSVAGSLMDKGLDAVIATNTTVDHGAVANAPHGDEEGGLSGAPLFNPSTALLRRLKSRLGDTLPIIGVGGICSGADAAEKLRAGASLVQVYTGLIYRGPRLVREMVAATQDI